MAPVSGARSGHGSHGPAARTALRRPLYGRRRPATTSPMTRASRPPRAASSPMQRLGMLAGRHDDEPDAHVERPHHVVLGTSPLCCSHRKSGGTSQAPGRRRAAVPCGSTRGRLSVMPPPVMCAMPLMRPASSSGRISGRYERCGSSSASPTVRASSGTCESTVKPRCSKTIRRASE